MNNTLAGSIHPLAFIGEDIVQLNDQLSSEEWDLFIAHGVELEAAIAEHFGPISSRITASNGYTTSFYRSNGSLAGRIVHEFGRDILQEQTPDFRGFQVVATVEFEVVG